MMNWNRLLSGLLATFYIVAAWTEVGAETGFKTAIGVMLPLACIWFGDEMGDYVGQSGSGYITEKSPGLLICILGWLLLFSPFIIGIVAALNGPKP